MADPKVTAARGLGKSEQMTSLFEDLNSEVTLPGIPQAYMDYKREDCDGSSFIRCRLGSEPGGSVIRITLDWDD